MKNHVDNFINTENPSKIGENYKGKKENTHKINTISPKYPQVIHTMWIMWRNEKNSIKL
ncbi:hypothetical protein JCM31739_06670 [Faecalimonas canis]